MNNKNRCCPVCDTSNSKLLFTSNNYDLVRCLQCKHIYVGNPNEDTSSTFDETIDINNVKVRHHQIVALLETVFSSNKNVRVAEIGSGYGHLGMLLSKIQKYHYVGYEPSVKRAEYCVMNGLNVVNALFGTDNKFFDVVVLDNVLEHVMNPGELLAEVSEFLKPNGIVIVIVPNRFDVRRFLPKWRKRHYWQPHCHINYFSYRDVQKLMNDVGLRVKSFGLSSLPEGASISLRMKTLLDILRCNIGGLYLYATKK